MHHRDGNIRADAIAHINHFYFALIWRSMGPTPVPFNHFEDFCIDFGGRSVSFQFPAADQRERSCILIDIDSRYSFHRNSRIELDFRRRNERFRFHRAQSTHRDDKQTRCSRINRSGFGWTVDGKRIHFLFSIMILQICVVQSPCGWTVPTDLRGVQGRPAIFGIFRMSNRMRVWA